MVLSYAEGLGCKYKKFSKLIILFLSLYFGDSTFCCSVQPSGKFGSYPVKSRPRLRQWFQKGILHLKFPFTIDSHLYIVIGT